MRWWSWALIAIIVIVLGGLFYFNRIQWGGPPSGPMPIYAAPVVSQSYTPTLTFTGRLAAGESAEIRPTFTGVVTEIHFTEGQTVKAGAPLFTLDLRAYNSAARQAAAQAQAAEAAYKRGLALQAQDAISLADLEQRRAARDAAVAAGGDAGVQGNFAVIKAPISGRVGRADAVVGSLVSREAAPILTTIQNTANLYADFDLPESSVLALMQAGKLTGAPVAVGLANEGDTFPYQATLTGLDNRIEPNSGSLRVRATLENADGKLLPGLFARVRLDLPQTETALLVNDAAIGTEQSLRYVYKINAKNQPERVAVTVGDLVEGLRVVIPTTPNALKAGDNVVVNGLMRIRPGMETLPFPADMRTTQPISGSAPLPAPTAVQSSIPAEPEQAQPEVESEAVTTASATTANSAE